MIKGNYHFWFLMLLFFTSCASLSGASDEPRPPSYAIAPQSGGLSRALEKQIKTNHPKSGFRLIASGTDAFYTRIALVQATEYSLDLQYYIVEDDITGRILLEEILRAADRGVRVRLLIDHLTVKKVNTVLAVLDAHPGIEIRGFNPSATKSQPFWMPALAWVTDLSRLSKRMHNKVLIMDNVIAVTGGRNLGNEYFDASSDFLFSDLDVLAAGPIVPRISRSFDRYWNSDMAFPLRALSAPPVDSEAIVQVRGELRENWEKAADTSDGAILREPKWLARLTSGEIPLFWAPAELSVDVPEKVDQPTDETKSPPFLRLDQLTAQATKEFVAVSPYFVPREEGLLWFQEMIDRGLKVKVLTNSLASTDVPAVHAGYARYREELVRMGVELYEFKPIPGKRTRQNLSGSKSGSRSSLHSKVYVVDGEHVVVGSFNLDPRSIELNTELVIVIHSREMADEALRLFRETTHPSRSYRVTLTEGSEGELAWLSEGDKGSMQYDSDPDPGLWRSMNTFLFSLLPVEDQL